MLENTDQLCIDVLVDTEEEWHQQDINFELLQLSSGCLTPALLTTV